MPDLHPAARREGDNAVRPWAGDRDADAFYTQVLAAPCMVLKMLTHDEHMMPKDPWAGVATALKTPF